MMKKTLSLILALCLVLAMAASAASYTVVPGDVLWKIAKNFGTDYKTLAEYNGIANPNLIFPGQVIKWDEPASDETPAKPAAETFSASAKGFGGEVTVTVTAKDGKMVSVVAVGDSETDGIGSLAIERLPAKILAAQSAEVDGVAGASVTSAAVKSAAAEAIAAAGAAIAPAQPVAPAEPEAPAAPAVAEADLLIIGAGGAGLTAANAAIQKGVKNVLVIEKMPSVGGASAVAGGLVGGCSKLQSELGMTGDSPDLIYNDIMTGGMNTNNPALVRLLADNQGATMDWLIDDMKAPIKDRYASDFPEHTIQRFFVVEGGSSKLTNKLAENFTAAGGTLMLETRATSLTTKDGAVTGCVASTADGGTLTITAKKTLLTTGGFGNNLEMLKGDISSAVFYGVASSTGDGHKMAEAIGAKMVMMEYAKMYPQGISLPGTNAGRATPTQDLTTTNKTGAIYVNLEGKRVCDENLDFVSIKKATVPQTNQMIFLVMDQTAFDMWSKLCNDYLASPAGRLTYEEQETFFSAPKGANPFFGRGTMAEAADHVGIDAAALAETVADWNAKVEAGKDDEFGREELFKLDPDSKYYIVEQRLRFATTLGGVDITDSMEVKNTSDAVIPNLYAAGEVVGGANGIEAMPGCMYGWAATSGRLAGEHIGELLTK